MIGRRIGQFGATSMIACLLLAATPAAGQSAGHILTQPARDVGLEKTKIPPVLQKVGDNPYSMAGAETCPAIARSIAALSSALGPDFNGSPAANHRNLAKVAGTAVVNSLIPFRGIVRDISGANAAERRRAAAVTAGVARRGFLRGMQRAKGCSG